MGSYLLNSGGSDGARRPTLLVGRLCEESPGLGSVCFNPETSLFVCRILARKLISIVSPAGASCWQSLLLDPDAMIRIDLHKWLFLLITGRGE
jgi:hypothetical protein